VKRGSPSNILVAGDHDKVGDEDTVPLVWGRVALNREGHLHGGLANPGNMPGNAEIAGHGNGFEEEDLVNGRGDDGDGIIMGPGGITVLIGNPASHGIEIFQEFRDPDVPKGVNVFILEDPVRAKREHLDKVRVQHPL